MTGINEFRGGCHEILPATADAAARIGPVICPPRNSQNVLDSKQGLGTQVFERFTDRARQAIILAREEAGRFRHGFVGAEHMLLALIRDSESSEMTALQRLSVHVEMVKTEVERTLDGYPKKTLKLDKIPFTPQAKRVLELSIQEARHLGHNYIGTEHLLFGLIKVSHSFPSSMLESLGARLDEVRQAIFAPRGQDTGSP